MRCNQIKNPQSGFERLPANGSINGKYDDIRQFYYFLCQEDLDFIANNSSIPPMLWNRVGTYEYAKESLRIGIALVYCTFFDRKRIIVRNIQSTKIIRMF